MTGTATPGVSTGARAILADARERQQEALSEREGLALLREFGVRAPRTQLVVDRADLADAVASLSFPLVLKVESPEIAHKSDVGGVRLGCTSLADAEEAFDGILAAVGEARPDAHVAGVLLEEQVDGVVECFVGAHADPEFGPVVGFGLGGVFVEVLNDLAWRAAPFDRDEALRMIDETLAAGVLIGWRGRPPADVEALADAIAAVSVLVWELRDEVQELDVNPLLVGPTGAGVVAVDSFVRLWSVGAPGASAPGPNSEV
jgi:succinyl-CoA synthetase beta subunit